MRKILAVARKELLLWAQKPGSWILVFIVPLFFIWIVLSVFGSSGTPVVSVYAVNEDGGPGGEQVMAALRQSANLRIDELETREEADQRVGSGEHMAAIIIPAGFTDSVKQPDGAKIDIIIDPARSEQANIVLGLVNAALGPLIVDAEVSRGVESSVGQVVQSIEQSPTANATPTSATPTRIGQFTPTPPGLLPVTPTNTPFGMVQVTPSVTLPVTPTFSQQATASVTPSHTPAGGQQGTPSVTPGGYPAGALTSTPLANQQKPATVVGGIAITRTLTTGSPTKGTPGTVTSTPTATLAPGQPTPTPKPASPLVKFLNAALKGIVAEQVQEATNNPQIALFVEPVSGTARKPSLLDYLVPGYSLMFVFFLVSNLAATVVEERQTGTLRRLLVAPVSRSQILLGKALPYFAIAVLQFIVVLLFSKLLFGIHLGNAPLALGLVMVSAAVAMAGMGVLIAAFARSEGQAGGLATVIVLALAVISGAMFPNIAIPGLQGFTPHYWAMQGFLNVMARGQGLEGALGPSGILLIMGAVLFTIGAIRFRFE